MGYWSFKYKEDLGYKFKFEVRIHNGYGEEKFSVYALDDDEGTEHECITREELYERQEEAKTHDEEYDCAKVFVFSDVDHFIADAMNRWEAMKYIITMSVA
jgi:hypothetical protein